MPRDTRRSGLSLVLAGLSVAGFFVLTDPELGLRGRSAGIEVVDSIRQARPGTWVGITGGMIVAVIGVWLMTRRTAWKGPRERQGWVMRAKLLVVGLVLMVAGGCAPSFSGQWLEESRPASPEAKGMDRDYVRLALDFDPISSVRVGIFNETAGVVDAQSVQLDQYFVFDGGRVAQFGAAYARLETNVKLTANVAGTARTFERVRGPGIFPPLVKIPPLTEAQPQTRDRYANASP